MVTKHNLPHEKPQNLHKHPPEYEADLNPKHGAGQNVGSNLSADPQTRPAAEIKELTRALQEFTLDELQQIPVVIGSEHLKVGATYVDLNDNERREQVFAFPTLAGPDSYYVPKAGVPYMLWNRLRRLSDPYRTR